MDEKELGGDDVNVARQYRRRHRKHNQRIQNNQNKKTQSVKQVNHKVRNTGINTQEVGNSHKYSRTTETKYGEYSD